MQKIVPHIWFDRQAREAASFYVAAFSPLDTAGKTSSVIGITTLHDTPSGDCDIVSFALCGFELMAMSAGPLFRPNPSVSFMVNFDPSRDPQAREHLDALWATLADGGTPLMPLGEYPFSTHYGWIQDKYGVSWQLILTNPAGEERPLIIPSLLFVGDVCGKAEEATDLYLSVFGDSKRGALARYPAGMTPDREGTIMFTDYLLAGQWFVAMDSAHKHEFAFSEGISLIVKCDTQEEIDRYWSALSAVPAAEQCGWLKDRYGLSWQITPTAMDEMMRTGTSEQIARLTAALLPMKKFDIAALERAFNGTHA